MEQHGCVFRSWNGFQGGRSESQRQPAPRCVPVARIADSPKEDRLQPVMPIDRLKPVLLLPRDALGPGNNVFVVTVRESFLECRLQFQGFLDEARARRKARRP